MHIAPYRSFISDGNATNGLIRTPKLIVHEILTFIKNRDHGVCSNFLTLLSHVFEKLRRWRTCPPSRFKNCDLLRRTLRRFKQKLCVRCDWIGPSWVHHHDTSRRRAAAQHSDDQAGTKRSEQIFHFSPYIQFQIWGKSGCCTPGTNLTADERLMTRKLETYSAPSRLIDRVVGSSPLPATPENISHFSMSTCLNIKRADASTRFYNRS